MMSSLPHSVGNGITHGVELINFTRWPCFTHQEDTGTYITWRLTQPKDHNAAKN
jgi:hypothetical protein